MYFSIILSFSVIWNDKKGLIEISYLILFLSNFCPSMYLINIKGKFTPPKCAIPTDPLNLQLVSIKMYLPFDSTTSKSLTPVYFDSLINYSINLFIFRFFKILCPGE